MRKICAFLWMLSQTYASSSQANTYAPLVGDQPNEFATTALHIAERKNVGFVTHRDLLFATNAGITIVNVSNGSLNLTGIYIQALFSSDGALGNNFGSAFGMLWSNVTLGTSSPTNTTRVGANFLYNMIMNYNYQVVTSNQSGTNETPGSTSSGTPWTVFLGVVKGPAVTTTSDIEASDNLVYISGVTSYSQQICVSCSDITQTCTTAAECFGGATSSTQQDVPCNLDGATGCAIGVIPP